jgi:hypothetical protein
VTECRRRRLTHATIPTRAAVGLALVATTGPPAYRNTTYGSGSARVSLALLVTGHLLLARDRRERIERVLHDANRERPSS